MTSTRRIVILACVGLAVLAGVLVVGYLPSRVDGGLEPIVRRVLAELQRLGAPEWVNYDFADFIGNVFFFVPIGVIAALLLPWRWWWMAIPIGAALSGALELGQFLFLPQRYASWTDVAANTIGAVLGALIAAAIRAATRRAATKRAAARRPTRRSARH